MPTTQPSITSNSTSHLSTVGNRDLSGTNASNNGDVGKLPLQKDLSQTPSNYVETKKRLNPDVGDLKQNQKEHVKECYEKEDEEQNTYEERDIVDVAAESQDKNYLQGYANNPDPQNQQGIEDYSTYEQNYPTHLDATYAVNDEQYQEYTQQEYNQQYYDNQYENGSNIHYRETDQYAPTDPAEYAATDPAEYVPTDRAEYGEIDQAEYANQNYIQDEIQHGSPDYSQKQYPLLTKEKEPLHREEQRQGK